MHKRSLAPRSPLLDTGSIRHIETIRRHAEAEHYKIETLANLERFQTRAETEVIRQQGFAEAEITEENALAWGPYNQAAIISQVIEKLPAMRSSDRNEATETENESGRNSKS